MDSKINETLENLRVKYQMASLDLADCCDDPLIQFDKWLKNAIDSRCDEPNAFVLSTVKGQRPRARVLLLKGILDQQLIFYTNYSSAKGQEIQVNDFVAMTFLWLPLQRQVRIEGKISKITPEASDDYFQKRPRGSQLGAVASPQSQKVSSRAELEKMFQEAEEKFKAAKLIPRPHNWGGYAVAADYIEFWQGRDNRMHDRIAYEKKGNDWIKGRLAP